MGGGLEAQENNSAKLPGGPKQSAPSQSDKPDQAEASNNNTTNTATTQSLKTENAEQPKPLGPPPRPAQNQTDSNTPEIFGAPPAAGGSLSLEPNPFEQSFGNPSAETPGGTNKLPSVAALTSPQSLIPGQAGSPFNWGGGSLRTGPLSPAMLSGPTGDYFSEPHHLRGNFPTPNESSLRSGLTPGGGGSMFPAPSPGNGQSLYMPNPTPNTLEFQKTAMSAAAKHGQPQTTQAPSQSVTSQPQQPASTATAPTPATKTEPKPAGPFDNHDNDAANGLYMLAQGRNSGQNNQQFSMAAPQTTAPSGPAPIPATTTMTSQLGVQTSPQMPNGGAVAPPEPSARGVSEAASAASDENDPVRSNTRGKRKANQNAANTNGRGKTESGLKYSNKKTKTAASISASSKHEDDMMMMNSDSDEKSKHDENSNKKLTDEEKRKNFLERNRVAALKCRQRKKQWLANLQNKVELYSQENDQLTAQITALREEIVNLKTLLLAHKDCPVTQQQGLGQAFMPQTSNMDPGFSAVNAQMAPYGMTGGPMPNQQVMAAQPVDRRFA
ncbi:bZIP transcription factor [Zalerion maritima]|uniref:BZIP transcription factor n=1 Tax=Zalerion maritima TaxID=339359 RepID=A0AAD5RQH7_9PEZI|nr:bZIP transcription factor [Zalerion maritima]